MLVRSAPILLALAYPALAYFALQSFAARTLGVALLALFALRLALRTPRRLAAYARLGIPIGLAAIAGSATALVWNDPRALLLTPALVNLALLAVFARSLSGPETLVETIAVSQAGPIPAEERIYCRKLTLVWCAFFLSNAAVTTALALAASREAWALYTGLVAYLLIGALFAAEFVYRHWRFRRYFGLPTDAWMRRLFPPGDSS